MNVKNYLNLYKIVIISFLFILVTCSYILLNQPSEYTAYANSQLEATVKAKILNIRSGPSTTYATLGKLYNGDKIIIIDKLNDWYKIEFNNSDAWIAGWLITVQEIAIEQPPMVQPAPGKVTVLATVLNLRSEPDLQASILHKLQRGEQVEVIAIKDGWYQIKYDDITGWIFAQYVEPHISETDSDANEQEPEIESGEENQLPDEPEPDEELELEDIIEVEIEDEPIEEVITATVIPPILNMRAGNSTSDTIITKLNAGQILTVIEEREDWLYVKLPVADIQGWVAKEYVSLTTTTTNNVSVVPKVIILRSGTNIRAGADTTYPVLHRANEGDTYVILSSVGDWFEIQLPSTITTQKSYIASWVVETSGIKNPDTSHGHANLLRGKTIVVDPGHGGIDSGAIGSHFRTLEKEINLSTAFYLEEKLKSAGANVIMTRSNDRFLSLAQRVSISHAQNADAFISIHYNTNHNPLINGTIVYHYSRTDKDSKLASLVQREIIKQTNLTNLGARQGNYYILRENRQLAILVEAAFISNYNDELLARNSQFQEKVAEGVFQGIIKYFNN